MGHKISIPIFAGVVGGIVLLLSYALILSIPFLIEGYKSLQERQYPESPADTYGLPEPSSDDGLLYLMIIMVWTALFPPFLLVAIGAAAVKLSGDAIGDITESLMIAGLSGAISIVTIILTFIAWSYFLHHTIPGVDPGWIFLWVALSIIAFAISAIGGGIYARLKINRVYVPGDPGKSV